MDVTPLIPVGRQIIQSYSENGFKVSGEIYQTPIIVTAEKTFIWAEHISIEQLSFENFEPFIEEFQHYDVHLFGTGSISVFPPETVIKELKQQNVMLDIMDTGAACRTYNVLMAEDRRVAAWLLIP